MFFIISYTLKFLTIFEPIDELIVRLKNKTNYSLSSLKFLDIIDAHYNIWFRF